MAFKPIDPKRDEFRRYLERGGVIEALTKMFVRLIKERPENPMEYLQTRLGDVRLQTDQESYLQNELEEARAEIQRLRNRILALDPTALDDEIQECPGEIFGENSNTDLELNENYKQLDPVDPDIKVDETENATSVISEENEANNQKTSLELPNLNLPVDGVCSDEKLGTINSD